MNKYILFSLILIFSLVLTSASLCKHRDGYYYDCSNYRSYNSNVQYSEYSYEKEYYRTYTYETSRDYYSPRYDYPRFRPSEYLWKRYPDFGNIEYEYYPRPSVYQEIFFYR